MGTFAQFFRIRIHIERAVLYYVGKTDEPLVGEAAHCQVLWPDTRLLSKGDSCLGVERICNTLHVFQLICWGVFIVPVR